MQSTLWRARARHRRRAALAALVTAIAALGVATIPSPAAGADPASTAERVTLRGIVREIAVHALPGAAPTAGEEEHDLVLEVGDDTYGLTGAEVPANAEVRVTGTIDDDVLAVESSATLAAAPVTAMPTEGSLHTLVMRAYWTEPDNVTEAQVASRIAGDDQWFRDVSYGKLGQTGETTPWLQIAGPDDGKCKANERQVRQQAKDAAVALGYDLSDYTNYVLYHPWAGDLPGSDCAGAAGWAYVGGVDTTLNGYLSQRETTHELGHNLGLMHANRQLCTDVVSGTCSFTEYGDPYSTMGGSSNVGHYSAAEKDRIGWLDGRLADLTNGGTATIVPMADDGAAVHGVKVAATAERTYWLDYRQRIDSDSRIPVQGTDGVQLRVTGTGSGSTISYAASLLDARPNDGLNALSATLRSGESWTSPEGIRLSVGAVNPAGAQLSVAVPPVINAFGGSGSSETGAWTLGNANLSFSPTATQTLRYGTTAAYGTTLTSQVSGTRRADGTYNAVIGRALTGLQPGTTYHYAVTITTPYGSVTSPDQTFVTAGPPVIAALGSGGRDDGAQWVLGNAHTFTDTTATQTLRWGPTAAYGSSKTKALTASSTGTGVNHSVVLADAIEGLTPGVTYHWSVTVTTAHGSVTSPDRTFVAGGPPRINAVGSGARSDGAQWVLGNADTYTATAATQTLRWGPTAAYGSTKTKTLTSPGAGSDGVHNVLLGDIIDGLVPGATYHWSLTITTPFGTATSGDQTFVAS